MNYWLKNCGNIYKLRMNSNITKLKFDSGTKQYKSNYNLSKRTTKF